jgi:mRNA-degrading endonuclease RelE of RelBE toxin-antitoxin system
MTIITVKMKSRQKFHLVYAPIVKTHLKTIERKYYSLIRTTVENELQFEPDVETRNRKPLKRPVTFEAEWELRFGPNNRFRVFYDIEVERNEVYILAIGVKEGNRLFIGGEEVEL